MSFLREDNLAKVVGSFDPGTIITEANRLFPLTQHGKEGGSDLQVTPGRGNPARVVVRADGSPAVSARVGDTIDRDTGQTHDLLDGGQLRVQSAPRSSR